MNYLLDTHVCIWAMSSKGFLSNNAIAVLNDKDNIFWISKISFLEIAIKKKIGKLPEFTSAVDIFVDSCVEAGFNILDLKSSHLETYNQVNFYETHRDPFDRYLLAAAKFEKVAIITKDEKFQLYKDDFKIVW